MSKTVDERVVSMQFDNKNFETNVAQSMSTLDKLKHSLRLDGTTDGMTNLGSAVETVKSRFSALEVMGVTALANITNSAVNAGKRMISALTIDPVKQGFQEYETQMNAVQTILANTQSKGTTLDQVNAALDELNLYADKTIYNFTEMTRNIGTFTAAGVDLQTSVNAIQGIANLAAVSGSTSQQASTAMYQLSQALASGTVKLMDWNSVVNAGMGGQVFQDALKETSEQLGTGAEAAIKAQGSFRESLTTGWLTSEVLTETLKKFTTSGANEYVAEYTGLSASVVSAALESAKAQYGEADAIKYASEALAEKSGKNAEEISEILNFAKTAEDAATKVKTFTQLIDTLKESLQSGWTQTWETIIGDFEEAKELWTEVSNVLGGIISESANARNEMLSGAFDSGWDQLLGKGIVDEEGYKESIQNIAKENGVNFEQMVKDAGSFEEALKKGLGEGTITSEMMSKSVTNLADKIRNMSEKEREAAGYTQEHLTSIEALEKGLKDGSISMEDFTEKMMRPSGRELLIESVRNAFKGLVSVVTPVKEAFNEVFKPLTSDQLYGFLEGLKELTSKFTISATTADNLKRTFKGVFALLNIGVKAVKALFGGFAKLVGYVAPAGNGLLSFTANIGDFIVGIDKALESSDAFNKIIEKIGTILRPIGNVIKTFVTTVLDSFSTLAKGTEIRFKPVTAIFDVLGKALQFVAPIFAAVAGKIGEALNAIRNAIGSAVGDADFSKFFDLLNGGIFAAIGIGIAKFTNSIGKAGDGLSDFVGNINGVLEGVGEAINAFTGSLKAKTLKTIASAIAILAVALWAIALIPSDKLTSSLTAITVLFIELMAALKVFTKIADAKSLMSIYVIGTAMKALATALLILAVATKIMSTMTWEEMGVGLISLTVAMGVLVGAVNLLPDKKVNSAAKAIKKMSKAILVLAVAIKIMSTMTWEEMAVGLVTMVVGLGALVAAAHLLPKNLGMKAIGMIALATSLVILSGALKIMATMSWDDIARSLTVLAGSLAVLVIAMNLMKKAIWGALAMPIIAVGLVILAGALKIMATMSWDDIARGLTVLAGSLIIIAVAVNFMKKAIWGALAILVVSAALLALAPVMKILGSMSWEEIAKGLTVLAGAFIIIGLAGAVLGPLVPPILGLAAAVALLGVGCLAAGAGLLVLSAAGAGAAVAITAIVSSLIGLIPYFIEQIGVGIIKLYEVIAGSADAIYKAITVIILALVDAIVISVPAIVDGILVLLDGVLTSLVAYTPKIVDLLFDLLIGIIDKLAERLPDLIQAEINLIMSLLQGVIDALKSVDPNILVNGIMAVGIMTALMAALALCAALAPAAMVGVLAVGAVAVELAAVLAAIGALAQIPGLEWLVNEGASFMQTIGTAIGQFLGGIVGGFAQGLSAALPQIGLDLSAFMTNAMPFIMGAKMIDSSSLDGVKSLVGIILALTGANILESLTSWFTGGSSLTKFGEEISAFAPHIKAYANTVKDIDPATVTASANAAKSLSELADNLPNSGGLVGWFAGENDMDVFGQQLPALGRGLSAFSKSVEGIVPENIVAAASAAQSIVDMSATIPNEGGVAAWFAGDNSIAAFSSQLPILGAGLLAFSVSVAGLNPENIVAATSAAQAIVDMSATIPNEGGVAAWFAGDNSIAQFASQLPVLGAGLLAFSISVAGINPDNIIAAAGAAKSIAEMSQIIPNEGGIVSWFTGDNSLANFASQFPVLGAGLLSFSNSVSGINADNVIAASNAAKTLAEMTAIIPNEGGMASWFAGDNSMANFASQLPVLGTGLLLFSASVAGINPENVMAAVTAAQSIVDMVATIPNEGGITAWLSGESGLASFASNLPLLGAGLLAFSISTIGINPDSVVAAANAAKSIVDMTSSIPNEGGIKAWFSGESGVAKFASQLPILGAGLLAFSISAAGVNSENIVAVSSAAKSITDMTSSIPNEGGIKAWFSGESGVAKFAENLPVLGEGLKSFSDSIVGINTENVTAAASAAKALAEITTIIPNEGGIKAWFSGESGVSKFSENLPVLGTGLLNFSKSVAGMNPTNVTSAANAAKTLVSMANTIPSSSGNLKSFGNNLDAFGGKLKSFYAKITNITTQSIETANKAAKAVSTFGSGIDSSKIKNTSGAIDRLIKTLTSCSKVKSSAADGIRDAMGKLAKISTDAMVNKFKEAEPKMKTSGENAIKKFAEGIKANGSAVNSATTKLISDAVTGIKSKHDSFASSGEYLGSGLVQGINSKKQAAYNAGFALGQAAVQGEKDGQKSNSPSKLTEQSGKWFGEGLVIGIDKMGKSVYKAGYGMGETAVGSLSRAITKIGEVVDSDMDTQPTIRPVIDLTDVENGVNSISGMFAGNNLFKIDLSSVGSVSASMAKLQNGKDSSDVVSSIDRLRKDMSELPRNTYSINGINVNGDADVTAAIETLVRAARIERRR